jgi:hypothetical protein
MQKYYTPVTVDAVESMFRELTDKSAACFEGNTKPLDALAQLHDIRKADFVVCTNGILYYDTGTGEEAAKQGHELVDNAAFVTKLAEAYPVGTLIIPAEFAVLVGQDGVTEIGTEISKVSDIRTPNGNKLDSAIFARMAESCGVVILICDGDHVYIGDQFVSFQVRMKGIPFVDKATFTSYCAQLAPLGSCPVDNSKRFFVQVGTDGMIDALTQLDKETGAVFMDGASPLDPSSAGSAMERGCDTLIHDRGRLFFSNVPDYAADLAKSDYTEMKTLADFVEATRQLHPKGEEKITGKDPATPSAKA